METIQAERVVKAVMDGASDYIVIAERAVIDPVELVQHAETIDRAIQLMRGFYKYGHENMQPAGLPAPRNPYYDSTNGIDDQSPEYYAYEAVQRGGVDRAKCLWICGQFGVGPESAEAAVDNVAMPWRDVNGWRTYVREAVDGRYVLQDRTPAKLRRHLVGFIQKLAEI